MSVRSRIRSLFRRYGYDVRRTPSWDDQFRQWIAEAERTGTDPNDRGDDVWSPDDLPAFLEAIAPLLTSTTTVLELGPGTGRVTRHIIGRVKHLVAVDDSALVCQWLQKYLQGKGQFSVQRIDSHAVPNIATGSIDLVIAHGVLHHLDLDEWYWFLKDFRRVLTPSGHVVVDFVDLERDQATQYERWSSPTQRCIFRPHHRDAVSIVAAVAGFSTTLALNPRGGWATIATAQPQR